MLGKSISVNVSANETNTEIAIVPTQPTFLLCQMKKAKSATRMPKITVNVVGYCCLHEIQIFKAKQQSSEEYVYAAYE